VSIAAIGPAISTPVLPPPTTTNVSQLARSSGSDTASAASNALRILPRTRIALSSGFTSAARGRQSSWPKYE